MAAEASTAPTGPQPIAKFFGTVKQVLDGGVIIVKGQPRNGPPPERTLVLADLDGVPRMARRSTPNNPTPTPMEDEPLAWESREFLRKLLVGKAVTGLVLRVDPNTQREYGSVYLGPDTETAENVSVSLVKEGLAKVRQMSQDLTLKAAESEAKDAEKGLWAKDASTHVRSVTWEVPDARQLVEQYRGRRIKAVVENVRDGSTVRAFLLPDFYHVTIMLSGVRTPRCETGEKGLPVAAGSEPYGLEAQYFTETKLLQQEVEVILESCNKANNMLIGSVIHPMGNIAEALLRFGYAKIVDWSLKVIAEGSEKYRAAEKAAKEKRLKQWENWAPPTGPDLNQRPSFTPERWSKSSTETPLWSRGGRGTSGKSTWHPSGHQGLLRALTDPTTSVLYTTSHTCSRLGNSSGKNLLDTTFRSLSTTCNQPMKAFPRRLAPL
jgi:staphylococcal nuclease domain-containing protein 1